jgi:hypothetical protein
MPFTIEYSQEADIIMVVVDGELSLSLLQELAGEVTKTVKKVGCRRILNDLRKAKPTKSTIDIYDMPGTARKSGVGLACKRALLVVEETDDFHFLETVFINQGHQVRMFTDLGAAESWLLDV